MILHMEQHAVPREITSFEFKLIGFMTIRQFYYLLVFGGVAIVFYFLRVIPYVNYLIMAISIGVGVGLAFGKYNERPIDNLIKNLFTHLLLPTQYIYLKKNDPPDYLEDFFNKSSQKMIIHHIDATKKLNKYMTTSATGVNKPPISNVPAPIQVGGMIPRTDTIKTPTITDASPSAESLGSIEPPTTETSVVSTSVNTSTTPTKTGVAITRPSENQPFLTGVIRDSRNNPVGNILVYIKTSHGSIVRLVKSNASGVFATFHPLPLGDYVIEAKDVTATNFFDTMNLSITGDVIAPISIHAKSA